MNQTESELKIARYRAVEREADSFGRVISVRRLKPSEQTFLTGITADLNGSDDIVDPVSGNQVKVSHRAPLFVVASVSQIDEDMIPFPRSRGELNAIYDRLDIEGVVAAGKALTRLLEKTGTANGVDEAKNLSGTPSSD